MSEPDNVEPESPQPCAARVMDEPRPPRPPRNRKEEPVRKVEAVSEPVSEAVDPMFFVAPNVTKKKMIQQERHHRMSTLKIV